MRYQHRHCKSVCVRLFGLVLLAILLNVTSPVSASQRTNWAATADQVNALGADFSTLLPANWKQVQGGWEYLDVNNCFTENTNCYGNNPNSPYSAPTFP